MTVHLNSLPIAPWAFDDCVLAGRPDRGLEQADDLAGLLGGHRQGRTAAQMVGDVAVVAVPVASDGRDPALDDLAVSRRLDGGCPGAGAVRSPVDVAGAEGVFLGIDPVLDEAALGADDPPAGPVDPADPAGSTWKSTSSNSRTIRPCPPVSTPSQGAGVSQAASRRQGPRPSWRAWSTRWAPQSCRIVPAGRGAAAPAARRRVAADRALEEQRPADQALCERPP